jgi:hypothetical protein
MPGPCLGTMSSETCATPTPTKACTDTACVGPIAVEPRVLHGQQGLRGCPASPMEPKLIAWCVNGGDVAMGTTVGSGTRSTC